MEDMEDTVGTDIVQVTATVHHTVTAIMVDTIMDIKATVFIFITCNKDKINWIHYH